MDEAAVRRACLLSPLLDTPSRESFAPHPPHLKVVRLSARQSFSRPRRSSLSPQRHSSKMRLEKLTKYSFTRGILKDLEPIGSGEPTQGGWHQAGDLAEEVPFRHEVEALGAAPRAKFRSIPLSEAGV